MGEPITLVLPYPPSANRLWRNMRGIMVKSQEARDYALQVACEARRAGLRRLSEPVSVRMEFYRPRQAGDLDNRIKAVLDGLQGVAFDNDSQVVEIYARRKDDPKHPRVEVIIEKIAA